MTNRKDRNRSPMLALDSSAANLVSNTQGEMSIDSDYPQVKTPSRIFEEINTRKIN